jgi:carbon storage regulator
MQPLCQSTKKRLEIATHRINPARFSFPTISIPTPFAPQRGSNPELSDLQNRFKRDTIESYRLHPLQFSDNKLPTRDKVEDTPDDRDDPQKNIGTYINETYNVFNRSKPRLGTANASPQDPSTGSNCRNDRSLPVNQNPPDFLRDPSLETLIMLVLARKPLESIHIGDNVLIKVLYIRNGVVRIGIDAPQSVRVFRGELFHEIQVAAEVIPAPMPVASTPPLAGLVRERTVRRTLHRANLPVTAAIPSH